jgi:hypothetical protein
VHPNTPHDDVHRAERLRILTAIEAGLADPVRLVGIVQAAADDEDAVRQLAQEYGLDDVQAQAMLDMQVKRVTVAHRALIAEELRVLRAEWGPPVEADVRFNGRRSAVLSIDAAEYSFRAGGAQGVLDRIAEFVLEEIAVPRLRPVVATITGLPDGPIRITYTPSRDGQYEYPDEPVARDGGG